jgi:hypothetical protein
MSMYISCHLFPIQFEIDLISWLCRCYFNSIGMGHEFRSRKVNQARLLYLFHHLTLIVVGVEGGFDGEESEGSRNEKHLVMLNTMFS